MGNIGSEDYQSRIDSFQDKISKLKNEVKDSVLKVAEQKMIITDLEKKLSMAASTYDEVKCQLQDTEDEIEILEIAKQEQIAKNKLLKKDNTKLQNEINRMKKKFEFLDKYIDEQIETEDIPPPPPPPKFGRKAPYLPKRKFIQV